MNVYPVDSQQHMLNPNDIFIVAAHEDKTGLKQVRKDAEDFGISPERMLYALKIKSFQDPKLIRIRSGNTLFGIKAYPNRLGYVTSFNGDTRNNYVNNMVDFLQSARKLGFDQLKEKIDSPDSMKMMKAVSDRISRYGMKSQYDSEGKIFLIITGPKRD